MKKKIDAMTAISVLLIVINLVVLWVAAVNSGSCGSDFEMVSQTSILNFGQLFGGTVYAMSIVPNRSLNGVIRSSIRYCTNNKFFLVFNINCIFNSKICRSKC